MQEREFRPLFEQDQQDQTEDGFTKLTRFIEAEAVARRSEGIPVGNDGRIDESISSKTHAESYFDIKKPAEGEQSGNISLASKYEKRRVSEDEQLGMLSYSIFVKNLGKEFVVARSSQYDNDNNSASTLILERQTGNLVCAFNEVAEVGSDRHKKRAEFVQKLNREKGGASLKYGIGSEIKNGKPVVSLSRVENVPVFYLALTPDYVRDGIKEFLPDAENQSEIEKRLFVFFVASINAQIKELEIKKEQLNPALRERLSHFKGIIKAQEDRKDLPKFRKPNY